MSSTLIFLFGMWFNPAQVVSLSNHESPLSDNKCIINLSSGSNQYGRTRAYSKYDCDETARLINQAAMVKR